MDSNIHLYITHTPERFFPNHLRSVHEIQNNSNTGFEFRNLKSRVRPISKIPLRCRPTYRIAMGLPGDPVAPFSGSGTKIYANSYTLSRASSVVLRFSCR